MNAEQIFLEELVSNTLTLFNENEKYLLDKNVSERCIVSKFAMHLDRALKNCANQKYTDYQVDVEYNRGYKGNDYAPKTDPDNNKIIVVDLVVHRRGYKDYVHQHGDRSIIGYDNLICMEFKKSSNMKSIDDDKKRLKMMTNNRGNFFYSIGFMIVIDRNNKNMSINERFFDTFI